MLFQGDNDFDVCLRESFPNLKVDAVSMNVPFKFFAYPDILSYAFMLLPVFCLKFIAIHENIACKDHKLANNLQICLSFAVVVSL